MYQIIWSRWFIQTSFLGPFTSHSKPCKRRRVDDVWSRDLIGDLWSEQQPANHLQSRCKWFAHHCYKYATMRRICAKRHQLDEGGYKKKFVFNTINGTTTSQFWTLQILRNVQCTWTKTEKLKIGAMLDESGAQFGVSWGWMSSID
jgi:hypothetical protein